MDGYVVTTQPQSYLACVQSQAHRRTDQSVSQGKQYVQYVATQDSSPAKYHTPPGKARLGAQGGGAGRGEGWERAVSPRREDCKGGGPSPEPVGRGGREEGGRRESESQAAGMGVGMHKQ